MLMKRVWLNYSVVFNQTKYRPGSRRNDMLPTDGISTAEYRANDTRVRERVLSCGNGTDRQTDRWIAASPNAPHTVDGGHHITSHG